MAGSDVPNQILTVLVLTYNEEKHPGRCRESVCDLVDRLVVVDSGSSDGTLAIAHIHGATVLSCAWTTHADRINGALDQLGHGTARLMRLDADEYVDSVLHRRIRNIMDS
jgi:glycosyltransferase involved in cell wall biosynthesis